MKKFDLEKVYDEKISPLMAQIIEICKEHKMPVCAEFIFRNSEDDREERATTFIDHSADIGENSHMKELWRLVRPHRPRSLNLTVRNGDGTVKEMISILD